MPRATTSSDTVRHPLKSAPPDGYVELRPMSYGDFLKRRDMGMKMGMTDVRKGQEKIDLDIIQETVTRFEFKTTIVSHNLEDAKGRTLNLSEPSDFTMLDPKVGQEISDLITAMIQWEDPKSDGDPEEGDSASDTVSEPS